MAVLSHASTKLFDDLDEATLADIHAQLRPRRFNAQEVICAQGSPGDSLFIIQGGVAQVLVSGGGDVRSVARLRRGEVVGEMALITGAPRSATVKANVPTDVLELTREAFEDLLAHYPVIRKNLNRILVERLVHRNEQIQSRRGEVVALVAGPRGRALAAEVIAAARLAAVAGSFAELTALTAEDALGRVDHLLGQHRTVVIVAGSAQDDLPLLLAHTDRVVALAAAEEVPALAARLGAAADRVEVALLTAQPRQAPAALSNLKVIRALNPEQPGRDVAWLGRHLTRTRLGLALGAGGAKGYAHVAALHVLEGAGYTVDYVAGSSIGAMVGSWLGLGMRAADIETLMRQEFNPESVAAMFKLGGVAGTSAGLDIHTRLCRETTRDLTFADLQVPLVAMAVDLNTREPAPIRDGPLWQALLASTALAGMFPPYQRGTQRLVDGLALVPVPTEAVRELGADVVVSVNIMSRDTLPAWPGQVVPPPPPARSGSRMLDTLLEVMDLTQVDSSVRHAALADVVVTPRFGPGTWRDFHLADLFLAAGRAAAEAQLASLRALARPQAVGKRQPSP
jgi:predicted acylesterase/phospholipase RssA/CRP-like cAMP-binding protein